MRPKLYSTFAGARRAASKGQAILRLLDDPSFECFIVLPNMSTQIMALDMKTGRSDGEIDFMFLSTIDQQIDGG